MEEKLVKNPQLGLRLVSVVNFVLFVREMFVQNVKKIQL